MRKPFLILFAILFVSCNFQSQVNKTEDMKVVNSSNTSPELLPLVENRPIKNVIFIIADGTGLAQITAGQYNQVGKNGFLNLQRMPVTGIVRTHSASSLITDSAAGATAYSCGQKTNNGMIAYLPDGTHCKTLLEIAEELGKSTGLVATSTITHATPASFAAHVQSRNNQAEIAAQYLNSGVEVFLGGGKEYFIPQTEPESAREDDRNLIREFQEAGYTYIEDAAALRSADSDKLLGLFADSGMESENRSPSLAEMTQKSLDILSQDQDGFFLMVEGSQIDWAGHGNDVQYLLREMADLDAAVKTILDFAQKDGETLVILTADHETGGMTLQQSKDDSATLEIYWTSDYHTGLPVAVMAYGPHAIRFTGWHDNTAIGKMIAELAGYPGFPANLE